MAFEKLVQLDTKLREAISTIKPTASNFVVLCCSKSSSCFKEYQCFMSGTIRKSQLSILGLVFKVVDISTAVCSLNKQICCTSEKTLKKIQATIFFLKRVFIDSYQVVL